MVRTMWEHLVAFWEHFGVFGSIWENLVAFGNMLRAFGSIFGYLGALGSILVVFGSIWGNFGVFGSIWEQNPICMVWYGMYGIMALKAELFRPCPAL